MKKLLILSILLLLSFLQFSCNTIGITDDLPITNPVDVYVAGSKDGKACYWKNGQVVMLDSGGFEDVFAGSIIISNTNIYVIGQGFMNNQPELGNYLFWKNGVLTNLNALLSTNSQIVRSIKDVQIIGDDIYILGLLKPEVLTVEIYELAYWKNGIKTTVSSNLNTLTSSQIKIQNNDIYIALNPTFDLISNGYFKNNTFYPLPNTQIGFTEINKQIVVFGSRLQSINGFYRNTVTNVNTEVPFTNEAGISFLSVDNNNLYYTNFTEIYKNGSVLYTTGNENITISDLKIRDNNVYRVIRNFINFIETYEIKVNDYTLMTSSINETYNSLLIVQN